MQKRKTISFDIGIKHLAYCVLESDADPDHHTWQILDWQVVNLLQPSSVVTVPGTDIGTSTGTGNNSNTTTSTSTSTTPICQESNKKGAKCGHKAHLQAPDGTPLCTKHAKQATQWLMPTPAPNQRPKTATALSKMDMEELLQYWRTLILNPTQSHAPPTTKKEAMESIKQLQVARFMQPIRAPKRQLATQANMVDLCQTLHCKLRELFPWAAREDCEVVIENQIGPLATRMAIIQGMITMFFVAREVQVSHVSSAHKLRYAATLVAGAGAGAGSRTETETESRTTRGKRGTQEIPGDANKKDSYKDHKKNATEWADVILRNNPLPLLPGQTATPHQPKTWVTHFHAQPTKKDDLADCFLQGIWFISTKSTKSDTAAKTAKPNTTKTAKTAQKTKTKNASNQTLT
jgi:hypothetical protein